MDETIWTVDFHGHEVRVVLIDDVIWFVGRDICVALDLRGNAWSSLHQRYKGKASILTPGGRQEMTIISEPGVHILTARSRKPEADDIQRWLFEDVIPTVMRTGRYDVTESTHALAPVASDHPLIQQARLNLRQAEHIARVEAIAKEAEEEARHAKEAALQAMHGQMWVTIQQYVTIHELHRQLPPGRMQQDYGKWLAGYCREQNIPVYKSQNAFERWQENTYWIQVIQQTLPGWLQRRTGQTNILPYRRDA